MEKVKRYERKTIDNAKVMQEMTTVRKMSTFARIYETYHLHIIVTLLTYMAIIVFLAVIVPRFFVEKTQVIGESMENTLFNGDDIIINKFAYRENSPSRDDLVVVYPKGNKKSDYLVKRVIGVPGETIQIINGIIYIDGKQVEEDYGKNAMVGAGMASVPIRLGKGEYFVLGDNRLISRDSRYSSVGIVKKEYIVGKVWLRIFPMDEFGAVK